MLMQLNYAPNRRRPYLNRQSKRWPSPTCRPKSSGDMGMVMATLELVSRDRLVSRDIRRGLSAYSSIYCDHRLASYRRRAGWQPAHGGNREMRHQHWRMRRYKAW